MKRLLSIWYAVGLLIICAFFLNGCSNSGVSEAQIQEEVSAFDEVKSGIISCDYVNFDGYQIESFEIEKRQTNIEDKEDIIYCTVVIKNNSFQSHINYMLIYDYFDDGGWLLGQVEIIEKRTTPLCGVHLDNIYFDGLNFSEKFNKYSSLNNNFDRDNIQVVGRNTDLEIGIDTIEYQYTNEKSIIKAQLIFQFDQNSGWKVISDENDYSMQNCPIVKEISVDWEKIFVGTFECDASRYKNNLTIKSYNKATREVSGSYSVLEDTTLYNPRFEKNENFVATFDEESLSFVITVSCRGGGTITKNVPRSMEYDISQDSWNIAVFGSGFGWNFKKK